MGWKILTQLLEVGVQCSTQESCIRDTIYVYWIIIPMTKIPAQSSGCTTNTLWYVFING